MDEGMGWERVDDATDWCTMLWDVVFRFFPLEDEEEDAGEDLSRRGTRRMEQALSGRGFRIELSREGTGVRGTAGGERRSTEMRDKGFHPEEFLRRVTLLEAAADRLGEN